MPPVYRESTLQLATSKILQKLNPSLRMSPESLFLKNELALKQRLSPPAKRPQLEERRSVADAGFPLVTSKIVVPEYKVIVEPSAVLCKFPVRTGFSHRSKSQFHGASRKLTATQDVSTHAFKLLSPAEDYSNYQVLPPRVSVPIRTEPDEANRHVVYQSAQANVLKFLSPISSTSSLTNEIKPKLY